MKLLELLNVISNNQFELHCKINNVNLSSLVTKSSCREWSESEVVSVTAYNDTIIVNVRLK